MTPEEINQLVDRVVVSTITDEWLRTFIGEPVHKYDVKALQRSIGEPLHEFLQSGGKRWRPRLFFLAAQVVGGETPEELLLVPELIHNGTLMVDDVEDGSKLRRGRDATHVRYGTAIAVNAGNMLYYLPMRLIEQSDIPNDLKLALYEEVNATMAQLHVGQGTDIAWSHGYGEPTEDHYLQMCHDKTGALARLAARGGAIVGGGTEKQVDALGLFASTLGIAFQIMDDIKNLDGTLGKEFGDDIQEGKRSLPAIYALASSSESATLREILDQKAPRVEEAVRIIKESGAIDKAREKARSLVTSAWLTLDMALPDSSAKNELKQLVEKITT